MARNTPAPANDPAAHANFLLKNTGLTADRTLASLTAEEFAKLLAAIQTYEGWKEGKIVPPAASQPKGT